MPSACLVVVDAQRRAPGASKLKSERLRWLADVSDPTGELDASRNSREIAQADGHERCALCDSRPREETVSDGHGETPELPPAPQLAVDLNVDDPASERGENCSDDQVYDVDDHLCAVEEEYQDSEIPHYAAEAHSGQ